MVDPVPIAKGLELGADRFLIILTVPPGVKARKTGFLERTAASRYFRDRPRLSDICRNGSDPLEACLGQLEKLRTEEPGSVVIIRPEHTLPAPRITRNRTKIVNTVNIGYDQVIRHQDEIRAFLQ